MPGPKYNVVAHPKVLRFLQELPEQSAKSKIKEALQKLGDYPLSLREIDVVKLSGMKRTFRVRIGRYRLIFHVDKAHRTILVTQLAKRESVYEE